MIDDSEYVVWDGRVEQLYVDEGHDCMVCHDGKLLSVQNQRREVLLLGHVPIVVFACERGMPCEEDVFDGKGNGVFTYYFLKNFRWSITLRNLIKQINDDAWKAGYFQKAEVVCLANILDLPLNRIGKRLKRAVVLIICDSCRTQGAHRFSDIK